jgi:hypothetical protein
MVFDEIILGELSTFAPPPSTPVRVAQSGAPQDGTYTFFPRLRAHRGGMDQAAYIERIEVRGRFMNIFLVSVPAGASTAWGDIPNFHPQSSYIQDLDRPQLRFNPVREAEVREGNSRFWVVTFEGVQSSRFTLVTESVSPHMVFDEVILSKSD